ncbi:hypothetical protein CALCODRAFT_134321 [Calocera cornea HHB12733]|uniref:Uncharacterized protein n=1 Tax=Calocera cornea HHB12733 TaxID=1353952 RepID=A0A165CVT9_9BASI|nr:hypothetical protein CALCODRAFT_134321 [Calocera cornea HHB12733]
MPRRPCPPCRALSQTGRVNCRLAPSPAAERAAALPPPPRARAYNLHASDGDGQRRTTTTCPLSVSQCVPTRLSISSRFECDSVPRTSYLAWHLQLIAHRLGSATRSLLLVLLALVDYSPCAVPNLTHVRALTHCWTNSPPRVPTRPGPSNPTSPTNVNTQHPSPRIENAVLARSQGHPPPPPARPPRAVRRRAPLGLVQRLDAREVRAVLLYLLMAFQPACPLRPVPFDLIPLLPLPLPLPFPSPLPSPSPAYPFLSHIPPPTPQNDPRRRPPERARPRVADRRPVPARPRPQRRGLSCQVVACVPTPHLIPFELLPVLCLSVSGPCLPGAACRASCPPTRSGHPSLP